MSILTLQVGQCGNQLGPSLFESLAAEYASASGSFYEAAPCNPFFRMPVSPSEPNGRPVARSILVDMEPSVVEAALNGCRSKSCSWTYSRRNCFVQQSGSGNNWAAGYLQHGPRVKEAVLDSVRSEIEESDRFGAFLLLHSVAGGTGSGLGSYLSTALADAFPKSAVMNYCVWPFRLGEVIVQSYNAVLSMAELNESSHALFFAENDALSEICQSVHAMKRPSFEDMNAQAMRALSAALLPAKMRPVQGQRESSRSCPGSWRRTVGDLLSIVCPRPNRKLLSCELWPQLQRGAIDYASFHWETLLQQALKATRSGRTERSPRSFSHFLTLRGKSSASAPADVFADDGIYQHGVARLGVSYSPAPFDGLEKSVSLISNAARNVSPVKDALAKARTMTRSKAFLHTYARHGLEEIQISTAASLVEGLVAEYSGCE